MASGASGEVVHCPKCNEDVPKTLYCLNCGFPLYKEEQPKEEKAEQDEMIKPIVQLDDDAVIIVDEPEEVKSEPKIEAQPEPVPEIKKVEPIIETPVQTVEPIQEPTITETKEPEATTPKPTTEVKTEELKPVEETKPVSESPPSPIEQPKTVQTVSEPLSTGIESSEIEAVEMVEEYQEEIQNKGYVPDPLTKDLMENLIKNISLKLKLIKLYRDGVVKEETFTKLFDDYLKQGKILFSRHDEIIQKLSGDLEEMEDDYAKSSDALELIEIRKSIGEVSEIEYAAKAPAYRWDIDHFDLMAAEKKNKIQYLENIGNIITKEELKELRELASLEYNTLDALQISKDESLNSIKESLYEAIKTLG
jgi:rubrerythrin